MDVQLRGRENRRQRAINRSKRMKELYDKGLSYSEIRDKVRREDGKKYTSAYVYQAIMRLKTI